MRIGTYYYPEQWPRAQWARDLDNIRKMGLRIVHLAEFAWFDLEPSPGEFRFDWLSDVVGMCADRGLEVILCTPTASPPVWLAERRPETLPVTKYGRTEFGGRRHYNPVSPPMRDATARIVTALADRFGAHQAIVGWQLDNEYGQHFDVSDVTHAAFRDWLRRKYGTIAALNAAWGNQFWNTHYTDWSQVRMPPEREHSYANPHHRVDASRFWSSAWAGFNKLQADILRPRVGDRWITHNFMSFHPDADPGDMVDDLSMYTWNSYPVHGLGKIPPGDTHRIGDPNQIGLMHDNMQSYRGRHGMLELQPGQVNWSPVPMLVYPGAVRLWLWTAFAHGAELVTTYRYRQPLWGVEQWHHGLVGTDGITPSPAGQQFAQVVKEIAKLDLSAVPLVKDDCDPDAEAGLLVDFEQMWGFLTLPQAKAWNQVMHWQRWYGALARAGLRVRVLHPNRPWPAGLKVIVAPSLQMVDDAIVEKLTAFASGGGHLVLTCRSGLMNRHGHFFEGPTAAPIIDLIGGQPVAYDALPDDRFGRIEYRGKPYDWQVWADFVQPKPETEVLGEYADPLYADTPAITRCSQGKGHVTYCGVYPEQPLADAIVEDIAKREGLTATPLPPRVQLLRRGPYRVLLNYQDGPIDVPVPKGAKLIVGTRRVPPAGVAVWEE